MKTLKEILEKSRQFLAAKEIAEPRRQAEELMVDALELKRIDLYMNFDRPLTESEIETCRSSLLRRGKGEPLQYIRGYVEFFDCMINVNRDVLIPRQETEILVDIMVKSLQREELQGKILWDVCCGSGCIGIALKKRFPELEIVLSDASGAALAIARENVAKNSVEAVCVQGDLLEPLQGKKADFIVCNPPYISEREYQQLSTEVRDHEPRMALEAQNEGLAFYQRLAEALPLFLNSRGKVWLEIGYNQGNAVQNLFSQPHWRKKELNKDWSGHDRFFLLEME